MVNKMSYPGGFKVEIKRSKSTGETKEQFEKTKADATYEMDGGQHLLELDGVVDSDIISRMGKQELFVTDWPRQLGPHLKDLKAAAAELENPETKKVTVQLDTANDWTGGKTQDGAIIFSNHGIGRCSQYVILNPKDDGGGFMKLITKDGGDVSHMINGSYFKDSERPFYFSESVTIGERPPYKEREKEEAPAAEEKPAAKPKAKTHKTTSTSKAKPHSKTKKA